MLESEKKAPNMTLQWPLQENITTVTDLYLII